MLRNRFAAGARSALLLAILLSIASYAQANAIVLDTPGSGSTVSGTVAITITMSSSVWWASIHIDGQPWGTTPGTKWYWNTTGVADGSHTITATAYDQYSNVLGSSSATVDVSNNQVVRLTAPANGATVSGSSVAVSITMNSSVWWASVHVDGQPWATTPGSLWYWNSTAVANGTHTLAATAYDQNGNVLGSSSASVTVQNGTSKPVALTAPANGVSVSGSVPIDVTLGPSTLWADIYVDGKIIAATPPDSISWNSTSVPDGTHTISTSAFASPDTYLGSASVTVNVSNSSPTVSHFGTLPPHASLPGESYCDSAVGSYPEKASWNTPFNRPPASVPQSFYSQPIYPDGLQPPNSDYANVTGNFTGTTDEIIRWAACKWGVDENVIRAQGMVESGWKQGGAGDERTTESECVDGSFSSLWNTTISEPGGTSVSCSNCCYQSWSMWQTKVFYEYTTWPMIMESTPFAADYRYAETRACLNGDFLKYFTYAPRMALTASGQPPYAVQNASGQWVFNYGISGGMTLDQLLWGCIGAHFSGAWNDSGSLQYQNDVKQSLAAQNWP